MKSFKHIKQTSYKVYRLEYKNCHTSYKWRSYDTEHDTYRSLKEVQQIILEDYLENKAWGNTLRIVREEHHVDCVEVNLE